MVKISVIVPVYNPGSNIDDCIRTLLDQSLPADEYEVIFVDDGSTDETPARLDALAAEHDNVRVEHIPNSGWPGRPRNLGTDLARGDYVYFVDNDDWLGQEALERLHAAAIADHADIVIGKVVGHGKDVPRGMFRRTRHGITFDGPQLLGLLTPHKLFRKAFLAEHGIRFPEGRRRLEDHLFVVHAYFHAASITVLSDYAYYHWMLRDTDENASFQAFDPVAYFENVREVLDLVEEHTEPGPFRDSVLVHWYRGKMLKRVGGGGFYRRDPAYNAVMVQEVRRLAQERYGPEQEALLAFHLRVRAHLLREGTMEDLMALAAFESQLRAKGTVDVRGRRRGASLRVEATVDGAEQPLRFERRGDRILWVPPKALRGRLPDDVLDATSDIERSRLQALVRSKADRSEFLLPSTTEAALGEDGRVTVAGEAIVDVVKAAGGARLPAGDWEVRGVATIAGFPGTAGLRRRARPGAVVVTVTAGGQVIEKPAEPAPPPTLKGRLARRLPWLARLVRRAGAGSGAARRR